MSLTIAVYVLGMVVVVVGMDLLFFRSSDWLWARLIANVGVILIFLAFYLRFLRRS